MTFIRAAAIAGLTIPIILIVLRVRKIPIDALFSPPTKLFRWASALIAAGLGCSAFLGLLFPSRFASASVIMAIPLVAYFWAVAAYLMANRAPAK